MVTFQRSEVNNVVGQNIRSIRRERKIKMETIAQALSISIAAYSKFETGVTDINFSRLKQIAAFFSVPIEKLISLDWDPEVNNKITLSFEEQRIRECTEEIIVLQQKAISLLAEIKRRNDRPLGSL